MNHKFYDRHDLENNKKKHQASYDKIYWNVIFLATNHSGVETFAKYKYCKVVYHQDFIIRVRQIFI